MYVIVRGAEGSATSCRALTETEGRIAIVRSACPRGDAAFGFVPGCSRPRVATPRAGLFVGACQQGRLDRVSVYVDTLRQGSFTRYCMGFERTATGVSQLDITLTGVAVGGCSSDSACLSSEGIPPSATNVSTVQRDPDVHPVACGALSVRAYERA